MNIQTSRPLLAAAALALAVGAAGAQSTPPASASAAPGAVNPAAGFQFVIDRIVAQGYRDVREIERKSDKLFEIEARDEQGRWSELVVDARSGEILRRKLKSGW